MAKSIVVESRPVFNPKNAYTEMFADAINSSGYIEVVEHVFHFRFWKCDIVHFHWPENEFLPNFSNLKNVLRFFYVWFWLFWVKFFGVKIVWTAHNSFPHEKKSTFWVRQFWVLFLKMTDAVVYLSNSSADEIFSLYPFMRRKKYFVTRHGDYSPQLKDVNQADVGPDVKEILGGGEYILHFGLVRPYKNVDVLIQEYVRLGRNDIRLVVAGKIFGEQLERDLVNMLPADGGVVLLDRFLNNAELFALIGSASLIVMPYKKVLNSGSALLALTFGKRIVVPALPVMLALKDEVGQDFVLTYEGEISAEFIGYVLDLEHDTLESPDLSLHQWDKIGSEVSDLYRRVVG